jgi:20S proteasome alpha/beta subunit
MHTTLSRSVYHLLILFIIVDNIRISWAQQSSAGQDTLIGIVGRDFVMMGADSSTSSGGGISLTSSNIDKIAVIHDGNTLTSHKDRRYVDVIRESMEQQAIAAGFAGDIGDGEQASNMAARDV